MSKKFSKFLAVSLICLVFSLVSAFAQTGFNISGSVTDSNNAVVVGATVTARNVATGKEITTTTDSSGKYSFSGLAGGSYRITVASSGFADGAASISQDGGTATQNFELSLGGIRDVVTVTAGKGSDRLAAEIPQTVTVATEAQIDQRLPRTTFESMERAPNLTVIDTSPSRERPKLRGLSSNRLLVVIDGEKLNNSRTDPSASGAPIAIVDPSQLESVEVIAGSGSSLYGSDAIGGIINLVTKGPVRPETGALLGFRFDGFYGVNGKNARGTGTMNLSSKMAALRVSFNSFRNANYTMGNGSVTLAQNVAMGQFFRQFPTNAAGTTFQSAGSYPIFALTPNQEIRLGEGHGDGTQVDGWFFPSDNHSFRFKYLNRNDKYNGNAFSGPPYETQERFSGFRDFNKTGIRYEGLAINKYIARVTANFYYQKISYPQDQYTWVNSQGATGSWLNSTTFTGNQSIFVAGVSGASYTDNRNTVGTLGLDLQATFVPMRGFFVTAGGGTTRDKSTDYFYTSPFTMSGSTHVMTGTPTIGASAPVSKYDDNNFYVQAELDRFKWVRVSGGFRFDNWLTTALPGGGFPLSTEYAALNAAIPGLNANPGQLGTLVSSLPSLQSLAAGTGTATSDSKSWTANFGVVGRLPFGINPYFRWANSYREPAITERYLIRNFSPGSFFASLVVGNPNLKPEKGNNFDVGVKVQQKYFNFSVGYFHNEITDLLVYAPAQNYCVTPVAGLPGSPGAVGFGCASGQAVVSINARINQFSNVIKGWESTAEGSIPLGNFGSLNPFYTLGAIHGTNSSPGAQQLTTMNLLYNRSDTPIRLNASASDFPLGAITPFRIIGGVQYLERSGKIFVEYNWRHQARITRADPNQFTGTSLINYGSFASMAAFDKHSIKAGYIWKTEKYKFSFNGGVDNITDALYWEHFQTAPAPGRSVVFGFTAEIFNLWHK